MDQPNQPVLPIAVQDETVTELSEDEVVDVDEPRPNPLNSTILHNLDEYFTDLDLFKKEKMIQFLHQFSSLTAKQSLSPWASPCLLVPKPDGTFSALHRLS